MSSDKYVKFECQNCEAVFALEFDVDELDEPSYCPFCSDDLNDRDFDEGENEEELE